VQLATTPEDSAHTSAQRRIKKARQTLRRNTIDQQLEQLLPFAGYPSNDKHTGLPFRRDDDLLLFDWSGRILCEDKKDAIQEERPAILQRLRINSSPPPITIKSGRKNAIAIMNEKPVAMVRGDGFTPLL
jgi:hypothetical protein